MSTTPQPFRYPDAPKPAKARILHTLKPSEWVAQVKMAGWRCILRWDGKRATFTSRENVPIEPSQELREEVEAVLGASFGTDTALLDTEYLGKFDGLTEAIVAFDLLQLRAQDLTSKPVQYRLDLLTTALQGRCTERFYIVVHTYADIPGFYESTKRIRGAEGIVIKRVTSRWIGDARKQRANPDWFKIKHREGVANRGTPKNPTPQEQQHVSAKKSRKPAPPAVESHIAPSLQPLAIPIDSVHPDPENARKHPEWNLEAIRKSLAAFGQQRPILVQPDGTIAAGNGTWEAAKSLGWPKIAAVTTNLKGKELTAYKIADNRTGELSVWDEEALSKALASIGTEHAAAAGFNEQDLAKMLGAEASHEDAIPEEPKGKPITKKGDLWTLGDHLLLCGSATDPENWRRLLGKRTAALVFTDPPYGVSYESSKGESVQNDGKTDDALVGLLLPAFKLAAKHADDRAAFYIWHASSTRRDFEHAMTAAGLVENQYLIWTKPSPALGRADYQWAHEPCFYASKAGHRGSFYGDRTHQTVWRIAMRGATEVGITPAGGITLLDGKGSSLFVSDRAPKGKKTRKMRLEDGQRVSVASDSGNTSVWEFSRDQNTIHPTQKPVALAEKAIENSSKAGELVVDPFMGSGTTLIAAEKTGRKAAGFDLEEKYCDRIVRRWQELTGRKATRVDAKGKPQKGI